MSPAEAPPISQNGGRTSFPRPGIFWVDANAFYAYSPCVDFRWMFLTIVRKICVQTPGTRCLVHYGFSTPVGMGNRPTNCGPGKPGVVDQTASIVVSA